MPATMEIDARRAVRPSAASGRPDAVFGSSGLLIEIHGSRRPLTDCPSCGGQRAASLNG